MITRTSKNLNRQRKRSKIAIAALATIGVLAVIWGIAFIATDSKTSIEKEPTGSTEETQQDKNTEKAKKAALAAADAILTEAAISPTNHNTDERIAQLDAGDTSVVTEKLKDSFHLTDQYAKEPSIQARSYQIALSMSDLLADRKLSENAWKDVFYDTETGIAEIPLGVFSQDAKLFHFQMVKVKGTWKLMPNSIMNEVLIGSAVSQNVQTSQS